MNIHPNAQGLLREHRNHIALCSRGRLAGPEDDPDEILEEQIKDAIIDADEVLTNCCHTSFLGESDFCSDCKEHAAAMIFHQIDRENAVNVTYDRHTLEIQEIEQA